MTHTAIAALTAVLLFGASSVAFAADDPTPAASATAPQPLAPTKAKPDPDDKIICKYDTPTGSRLGAQRTCRKKRDWEQMSRDAANQRLFAPPGAH